MKNLPSFQVRAKLRNSLKQKMKSNPESNRQYCNMKKTSDFDSHQNISPVKINKSKIPRMKNKVSVIDIDEVNDAFDISSDKFEEVQRLLT